MVYGVDDDDLEMGNARRNEIQIQIWWRTAQTTAATAATAAMKAWQSKRRRSAGLTRTSDGWKLWLRQNAKLAGWQPGLAAS